MIPVAILAGGLATRLRPMTETIPKSLIMVAGEPFIDHQLRLLKRESVRRVVLCAAHLGELIRDYVGNGERYGLEVCYSFDGEQLLGTGGALRRALPLLDTAFFVLYGDSYLDIDYRAVLSSFERSGAQALMTVYRNDGRWDTSNVQFDGSRVVRYEKRAPTPDLRYIDYGLGILSTQVLAEKVDNVAFDLADIYTALATAGQLAGYEATRRFYEIGTPVGLAETDNFLRTSAR